ncbi:MAG: hypothetical protein ACTSQO_07815 [Candidatus Helarchaeota archaeon]
MNTFELHKFSRVLEPKSLIILEYELTRMILVESQFGHEILDKSGAGNLVIK